MKFEVAGRYADIIRAINDGIDSFNAFIAPSYVFSPISTNDPQTYTDSLDEEWGFQGWPSKDHFGVYVLCCESEKDGRVGVYIGKASLKVMGHRIYHHLNPHRASGRYIRVHNGETFLIEAILASPVKDNMARCLASALEEHIIARGISNAVLLNTVGARG